MESRKEPNPTSLTPSNLKLTRMDARARSEAIIYDSNNTNKSQFVMQKRKAGRKKFQETRHPFYKGVRRRNGKWVCEMRQPNDKNGQRVWLGTFSCPEMAARAHDAAAWAFCGEFAGLNFPDSAHLLPRARSSSLKDIQVAALEAAEKISKDVDRPSDHDGGDHVVGEDGGGDLEVVFWDEEEVFNMPALLDGMAEGLILTPPARKKGFNWQDFEDDDGDHELDFTLWSY